MTDEISGFVSVMIKWNNDGTALHPSSPPWLEDFRFFLKADGPLGLKTNECKAAINSGWKLQIAYPAEKWSSQTGTV